MSGLGSSIATAGAWRDWFSIGRSASSSKGEAALQCYEDKIVITEANLRKAKTDNIVNMMPLSMAGEGENVVVEQVRGGRKLRQRLCDLGLNIGARVRIIKNEMPGPLIVAVKEDGRLGLGRGMSHKILVTPYNHNT